MEILFNKNDLIKIDIQLASDYSFSIFKEKEKKQRTGAQRDR